MRLLLIHLLLLGLLASAAELPPVVFVHGNGDDATKWVPTVWLFESNGYPKDRLFAIRLTDPVARREDSKPEAFRSSTTDQASELAAFVARVLLETKAKKVALVGSSRGGLTIRNYLRNAGGWAVTSHAVLCGTPNHGVISVDGMPDMEFNAKGNFLRALNQGSETVEGIRFLTIRSDKQDKFAQPNVGYDAPALQGAEDVVLPGLDHREVAFHPKAFSVIYRFLTNTAPARLQPVAESAPVISGFITAFANGAPTNRPAAGIPLQIFALRPGSSERDGVPLLDSTTTTAGAWGPLPVAPNRGYEFVLTAPEGRTITYFITGIHRSTTLLNLRLVPPAPAPGLQIHRPQGYFSKGRDAVKINGLELESIPPGIPTRDSLSIQPNGPVTVELREELLFARPALRPGDTSIATFLWE